MALHESFGTYVRNQVTKEALLQLTRSPAVSCLLPPVRDRGCALKRGSRRL